MTKRLKSPVSKPGWLQSGWAFAALLVFILALSGQAVVLSEAVFGEAKMAAELRMLAAAHVACAAIQAVAMFALLPLPHRDDLKAASLFFLLSVSIPILGPLGLLGAVVVQYHYVRPPDPVTWRSVPIPPLPHEAPVTQQSKVGEAGLLEILENAHEPEHRIKAVLATRRLPERDAILLLRVALADTVDEVRLLAYSLLDRTGKGLDRRIKEGLHELDREDSMEAGAKLHFQIAQDYWESAYLGLATGEVLAHVLELARIHAEAATIFMGDDANLYYLLGRIRLQQDQFDDAEAALNTARDFGKPEAQVTSYLAEVSFARRRFQEARERSETLDASTCQSAVISSMDGHW